MNHFYIKTNLSKDPEGETTGKIIDYLTAAGKRCTANTDVIPEDTDCILVLGGDGTLLRAARNLGDRDTPLLGINLGHLGYLTEGDSSNIKEILDSVISGRYIIEERMMIAGTVIRAGGEETGEEIALNDITISRTNSLKVIRFNLFVNGQLLYTYAADGIIISTPTGSTAYNLSCGGPIVEPTAKLFVITPLAPHSLNDRSLVFSSEDIIEIELLDSTNDPDRQIRYASSFDGDCDISMEPGDRVRIRRADRSSRILKLSTLSFLETLRRKMPARPARASLSSSTR